MKKAFKWIGIFIGGLLALVAVAAIGLGIAGTSKLNKSYDINATVIEIPADEVALARGEHLTDVFCRSCHGTDLDGSLMIDDPAIGTIYAPNITGAADRYTTEELILAIRHGLGSDGRALMIMPAESFIHLSEEDLGAVIAYLNTLPETGEERAGPNFGPMGRIVTGIGGFDASMPASYIDHHQPFHNMPEVGATVEFGRYTARFCQGCHGAELAGGQPPAPDSPPGPNLTPGGALAGWSEVDFLTAMRTGERPGGTFMDSEFMPWESFGKMSDEELRGVWMYLQSLPPRETAAR